MLKTERDSLLVINRIMQVYQTKETSSYNHTLTSKENTGQDKKGGLQLSVHETISSCISIYYLSYYFSYESLLPHPVSLF